MKMISSGMMNASVILVKIFGDEKIDLNDWLKIPKKPMFFMSSSVRSILILVDLLKN